MNRKFLLATIFVTSVLTSAFSQKTAVHVGIKTGLSFSNFNVSDLSGDLSRVSNGNGFYVGSQVEVRLNKKFSIQPEILYTMDEAVDYVVNAFGTEEVWTTENLRHLRIPVLAKLHIGHLGLYAGPQLSFLLSSRFDQHDFVNDARIKVNATDSSFSKTSFSGVVGLEYTFMYRFGIEARYQFGLSNIRASNGTSPMTYLDNQNIKLSGFQTGLYYRFGKRYKRS